MSLLSMFSLTWRAGGTCWKVNMTVITAWLKSWSSGTYTLHPCTKGQGFGQNYHLVLRIPKDSSDCIFSFFAWQFSFNNFMIFYILSSPVIVLDLRLCLVLAQKPTVDVIALDFQRLWDETCPGVVLHALCTPAYGLVLFLYLLLFQKP